MFPRNSVRVLVAYVGLSVAATFPLVLSLRTAVPTGEDTWPGVWNLWWVNRSLTAGANPFFCPDIYFPYGASLYFHTLNLLQAAAAVPIVRVAGLVAAYNFV